MKERVRGEGKKKLKKKHPERTERPSWTKGGFALTVARFESLFVSLLCFIYARTHVTNEHFV